MVDKVSDGYPVYLLNLLIDVVIDQLKVNNLLFKQLLSIAN